MLSYTITQEASEDIKQAYNWYENQQTNLGERFLNQVLASIQRTCTNPSIYPKKHLNYQQTLVEHFPYVIFFRKINNTIVVFAVFNTKQDPYKKPS